MPYYPDLSPYEFATSTEATGAINVGWLDAGHPYPRGRVHPSVLDVLFRACLDPVRPMRGWHRCPFCNDPGPPQPKTAERGGRRVVLGNAEICVHGPGATFIAPNLIFHYCEAHEYLPPPEFLAACALTAKHGPHA